MFKQGFPLSFNDFLESWIPGSPLKSYPGQVLLCCKSCEWNALNALNIFKSPQINDSQLSSEKNLNIMSPTSYSIMHGYDDNASWSLVGDSETSVQLGHWVIMTLFVLYKNVYLSNILFRSQTIKPSLMLYCFIAVAYYTY